MPSLALEAIRIILVEPAGPLNVGSVARVMKNMGLSQLVLVNPHCDYVGSEARQMAVRAADVLEAARVVATLADGLVGCRRAIAATGRPWSPTITLEAPRDALPWLLESAAEPDSMALIFGPEDRGLNNEELSHAHRFVYIPANPDYPSLNLAQAVGICCYELHQYGRRQEVEGRNQKGLRLPIEDSRLEESEIRSQKSGEINQGIGYRVSGMDLPHPPHPHSSSPIPQPPAPLDELEGFYQQFEALLLEVGYLLPHTADSRMKKFRRLYNRALPTSEEVAMLRGVLRQMSWALKQVK
ncbi:MAG: RNA methyltransferase [Oscillatoriales cyanobacterium C42_A2020_001]|nr:RNA methyltransferase [Leptolyngbyaceae cyanobacterium C42_A2020_001]